MDYIVQRRSHEGNPPDTPYEELIFNETPFNYFEVERQRESAPRKFLDSIFGPESGPILRENVNAENYYPNSVEDHYVWANFRGKTFQIRLFRRQELSFHGQKSWGREISILMADYFNEAFLKKDYRVKEDSPLMRCYDIPCSSHSYLYKAFNGTYSYLKQETPCPFYANVIKKEYHNIDQTFIWQQDALGERYGTRVLSVNCLTCPCHCDYSPETPPGHVKCKVSPFRWPKEFEWPIKE